MKGVFAWVLPCLRFPVVTVFPNVVVVVVVVVVVGCGDGGLRSICLEVLENLRAYHWCHLRKRKFYKLSCHFLFFKLSCFVEQQNLYSKLKLVDFCT